MAVSSPNVSSQSTLSHPAELLGIWISVVAALTTIEKIPSVNQL